MKRWFLPHTPDLIGLLRQQAQVTVRGIEAFKAWSTGELERAGEVRSAEHEADDVRRQLQGELRAAFSTPLDAEDLYELSERLDTVLNGAKNAVREAEVMAMEPDRPMAEMGAQIADGVRHLAAAYGGLGRDPDRATTEANAAIKCERVLERSYRAAMSALLCDGDISYVVGRRELYRRYARVGEQIVRVAHRVWYAVVKAG
jgi:uncharacterized protein Yka (UPF0111/DUF47 family)